MQDKKTNLSDANEELFLHTCSHATKNEAGDYVLVISDPKETGRFQEMYQALIAEGIIEDDITTGMQENSQGLTSLVFTSEQMEKMRAYVNLPATEVQLARADKSSWSARIRERLHRSREPQQSGISREGNF